MKHLKRQTKVIATIGPASEDEATLAALLEAGVDVCRLNMAHASHDWVRTITRSIREVGKRVGREPAVMMDVKGPEIRTGFRKEKIQLEEGQRVDLVHKLQDFQSSGDCLPIEVNYGKLHEHLEPGNLVLLDNGLIRLEVLEIEKGQVRCKVTEAGELGSRRHVNLPGTEVDLPSLTEKDMADALVGIEEGHDFFALSFTRDAESIDLLRRFLSENASEAHIIAKIEDQSAVRNLDEIVRSADGLMVARGDLGIECAYEELPIIQRRAVGKCLGLGKPVIVATHLLESMIDSPVPTRAEISDIANAVNEGADCLMLSGETTQGERPVECVRILNRIAGRIEQEITPGLTEELRLFRPKAKMLRSAAMLAMKLEEAAVLVFTRSGDLAEKLAALRPNGAPVFAFTDVKGVHLRLRLRWGIEPFFMEFSADPEQTILNAIEHLRSFHWVENGDQLVTVTNVLAHGKVVESIQLREVE